MEDEILKLVEAGKVNEAYKVIVPISDYVDAEINEQEWFVL